MPRCKFWRLHSNNGFTLLELAIVVGIIGLVALIAVPNIRGRMHRYRVESAASKISAIVTLARAEAMAQSRAVNLEIDVAAKSIVKRIDKNDDGTFGGDEIESFSVPGSDIQLWASAKEGTFSPRGLFRTLTGWWLIRVESTEAYMQYLIVMPGGNIEKTDDLL